MKQERRPTGREERGRRLGNGEIIERESFAIPRHTHAESAVERVLKSARVDRESTRIETRNRRGRTEEAPAIAGVLIEISDETGGVARSETL